MQLDHRVTSPKAIYQIPHSYQKWLYTSFFFFHICSSNSPRPVNKRQSVKLVELPFKNWCTVFYKNIIVTRKKPHIRFNRFKGFHYINLGEIIRLGQVFLSNLPSFALHARWEQLQMALRMCLHSCSSGVFINFNKGPRPRCHRGVKHISGVFNLSPFYVIPKTDLCLFFCFFSACRYAYQDRCLRRRCINMAVFWWERWKRTHYAWLIFIFRKIKYWGVIAASCRVSHDHTEQIQPIYLIGSYIPREPLRVVVVLIVITVHLLCS